MSIRSRRIARGVALLDAMKPGWHRHINRPLDLSSNTDCVLGQAYGDFEDGISKLGILLPSRYGFMTHCTLYAILTYPLGWVNRDRVGEFLFRRSERKYVALWNEVIDARREEAASKIMRAQSARRLAEDIEIFIHTIHKDALYSYNSQKVDA